MLRPLLALLALSCAGPGLGAEAAAEPEAPTQKSGVLLDKVIAVVNEGVVTQGELEEQVGVITQRLREAGTPLPSAEALRAQILERLVVQELQLQKANRSGVKISDEDLNEYIRRVADSNKVPFEKLPAAMAAAGIDYQTYRDGARKDMAMRQLQNREVRRNIRITPRELDQFIERIRRLPDGDAEYNTSHILLALPADATQAQMEEMTKRAEELIARAKTEQFSTLAVANSNSTDALEGGSLGWRKGGELPSIFADVVLGLKPGEISDPLVDPSGIHLVRLNEVRSAQGDPIQDQVHARHILMKPNELQDDATVRLKLANLRERVLKGEDFGVFASSMSEDKGSAADSGDLDWKNPEAFDPVFSAEIAKLADNEISEPFQTQFGWHIVQLLGRRKFDTTEDSIRDRATQQLVEAREVEETELWLRRLRDEAYVETSM
ncbi:MAG: peptidylprolyl isomerase [Pseudomonadota bacterium]